MKKGTTTMKKAAKREKNPLVRFLTMIMEILTIIIGSVIILKINGEVLVAATKLLNVENANADVFSGYLFGDIVKYVFQPEFGFLLRWIIIAWCAISYPIIIIVLIDGCKSVLKNYVIEKKAQLARKEAEAEKEAKAKEKREADEATQKAIKEIKEAAEEAERKARESAELEADGFIEFIPKE